MGCISSKIATRSRSLREELSQSLQRRVNGFPVLEDIVMSKNAGDQLLALVCTANTVAKKLQNGTCTRDSNSQEDHLPLNETINARDLMADLEVEGEEEERGVKQQQQQLLTEQHDNEAAASTSLQQEENGQVADDCGVEARCRSIRTVEEFDALAQASNRWSQAEEGIKEDKRQIEEEEEEEEETIPAEPPLVVVAIEDGKETIEKGSRIKAKAKELGNLSIPTTIDFPVPFANSEDWAQLQGQTFSSADYVTPRFGSFSSTIINSIDCGRECNVFDPDLLASFEDAMRQMIEEEESILQQIVESLEEEGVTEEEYKECV